MPEQSETPDFLVLGGGGGVPFLLESVLRGHPETRMAAVVNATDSGGHSGAIRRTYSGTAPPGDAVKSIGATAGNAEFSLVVMKSRVNGNESFGNNQFLRHYQAALVAGETDPNQAALDGLAAEAASVAPVMFATRPASLTLSLFSHQIAAHESAVADFTIYPDLLPNMDFAVVDENGESAAYKERPGRFITNAANVILAPSHPFNSLLPTTWGVQHFSEEVQQEISQKTTMVIGTENPWNTPGITVADQYDAISRTSGISPARIAIGANSEVPLGDLPDGVEVISIDLPLHDRPVEPGNPLNDHKPNKVYDQQFGAELASHLGGIGNKALVSVR